MGQSLPAKRACWVGDLGPRKIRASATVEMVVVQWKNTSKPWIGTEVPCDNIDKQLFHAAMVVNIGNGHNNIPA